MKLYYLPGACSLASHIMLHEVGAKFDIESVDVAQGLTESGRTYREISPNGYVPALEIETGDTLTEGVAILQYIADTHPYSTSQIPTRTVPFRQSQAPSHARACSSF